MVVSCEENWDERRMRLACMLVWKDQMTGRQRARIFPSRDFGFSSTRDCRVKIMGRAKSYPV